MIEHSADLKDLAAALAKAQAAIEGAKKDHVNPQFGSRYADLDSVWSACRGPLTDNGLSVSQWPGGEGTAVTLSTMLLHSSGQWIKATASATAPKDNAQGVGSVITYLRRYALAAVAGVTQEDDDGNAGSKQSAKRKERSDEEQAGGTASHPVKAETLPRGHTAPASPAAPQPKGFNLAGEPMLVGATPENRKRLADASDMEIVEAYLLAAKNKGYERWCLAAQAEQDKRAKARNTSEKPAVFADQPEDKEADARFGAVKASLKA